MNRARSQNLGGTGGVMAGRAARDQSPIRANIRLLATLGFAPSNPTFLQVLPTTTVVMLSVLLAIASGFVLNALL